MKESLEKMDWERCALLVPDDEERKPGTECLPDSLSHLRKSAGPRGPDPKTTGGELLHRGRGQDVQWRIKRAFVADAGEMRYSADGETELRPKLWVIKKWGCEDMLVEHRIHFFPCFTFDQPHSITEEEKFQCCSLGNIKVFGEWSWGRGGASFL